MERIPDISKYFKYKSEKSILFIVTFQCVNNGC